MEQFKKLIKQKINYEFTLEKEHDIYYIHNLQDKTWKTFFNENHLKAFLGIEVEMKYDEVRAVLNSFSNRTSWYPEKEQLLVEYDFSSYTYDKNRWDNLHINTEDIVKAVHINPINDNAWNVVFYTKEQVEKF